MSAPRSQSVPSVPMQSPKRAYLREIAEQEIQQAFETVFRPIHRVLIVVHWVCLGAALILAAVVAVQVISNS